MFKEDSQQENKGNANEQAEQNAIKESPEEMDEEIKKEQEEAAVLIQSKFRGNQARKEVEEKKQIKKE